MTEGGDPQVYQWAERELARIETLDESEFTENNSTRLDEKKKQLRKVLSFRNDGGGGESSSTDEDRSSVSCDRSRTRETSGSNSGGEPPKPSDSKAGGDEDSDTLCIHSEDKPEPDGWATFGEGGLGVAFEQKKSAIGRKDMIERNQDIEATVEPFYRGSTIRDTIEKAGSLEKLKKVFGRRRDEERRGWRSVTEEDVELETAAEVDYWNKPHRIHATGDVELQKGYELVRRGDAEQAIVEANRKTAEAVKQDFFARINQRIENLESTAEAQEKEYGSVQPALRHKINELENLRGELENEVEKE